MDRTLKDALRQRVAIAVSAIMSNTPSYIAEELTGLVEAVGPTRIRAAEIVLLVELFAQQLLATPLPRPEEFELDELSEDDEDDLVRTAWVLRALVDDGARQDGPEVTCLLGPTLLAMATHFTGRTSHVRPEALGASKATVDAAMEVLGWSVSANPAERLVAALTATDARLVTPLLDDPDVLVRAAAAMHRTSTQHDRRRFAHRDLDPAIDEEQRASGLAASVELERTLQHAGLAVPQVARRFAEHGRLTAFDTWHVASKPFPDAFADYTFDGPLSTLLGPVADQFAISHAGHGINSYGLNLRLALGPVAMQLQVAWGGAYGGADDAQRWAALVAGVDLVTAGMRVVGDDRLQRRRWLIVHSDFRIARLPQLLQLVDGVWTERHDLGGAELPEVGQPSVELILDRWVRIHNVIEQDLLVQERDWGLTLDADGELIDLTVPDPADPYDPSDLVAISDDAGVVLRLEYHGDDDVQVRRHGVWARAEDPEPTSTPERDGQSVLRTFEGRTAIGPAAIPLFDAAERIGLRLPVTHLVPEG
jgi:hypothetical protein